VGVDLYTANVLHAETVLTQLVQEGLEEVPGHDGVEVDFGALMFENALIIFPRLLNTKHKLLLIISILQPIKPGPINKFIIKRMHTKIELHLEHLLNFTRLRKPIRKLILLLNPIKIIMIKTVNVEGLSLGCLLIFYCLLQLGEEVFYYLVGLGGDLVVQQLLVDVGWGLLDLERDVDVLFC
jgi:hypothetical protein